MKSIEEGKEIAKEIAEFLCSANKDQKILIKGIMLGVGIKRDTEETQKAG